MTLIRRISKYPLRAFGQINPIDLSLPAGGVVRHFDKDGLNPAIWIEFFAHADGVRDLATREFHIIGTGQPIDHDLCFVGTCRDDPFIWHLFERIRP